MNSACPEESMRIHASDGHGFGQWSKVTAGHEVVLNCRLFVSGAVCLGGEHVEAGESGESHRGSLKLAPGIKWMFMRCRSVGVSIRGQKTQLNLGSGSSYGPVIACERLVERPDVPKATFISVQELLEDGENGACTL